MKHEEKEKGQSLLEFALILPVLIILLAGVLDLGRLYYAYVSVTDAAAEGATYAAIHPPVDAASTTAIRERAQAASYGFVQIDSLDQVTIECPTVASGASVTVTVNYDFLVVTPFVNLIVSDGVIPLRSVATEVILVGEF